MQITIIAGGSRGDVQPYVALGRGLKKAGHTVRVLSSDDFHDLVKDAGLDLFPTGAVRKPWPRISRCSSSRARRSKFSPR